MDEITIFYDEDGKRLGSYEGILPITLRQGMLFTIHGHDVQFEVVDWNYHQGHPDENAGLRIILKEHTPF